MVCGKNDKLSYRLFKILYYMSEQGIFQSRWLHSIRTILQKCELDYFWYTSFNCLKWTFFDFKLSKNLKNYILTVGAIKLTFSVNV